MTASSATIKGQCRAEAADVFSAFINRYWSETWSGFLWAVQRESRQRDFGWRPNLPPERGLQPASMHKLQAVLKRRERRAPQNRTLPGFGVGGSLKGDKLKREFSKDFGPIV